MLCDRILEQAEGRNPMLSRLTKPLAQSIRSAVRMNLEPSTVHAAVALSLHKPSNLLKMIDLARAPHTKLWIEWAEADKRSAKEELKVYREDGRPHPHRVGCYIESLNDQGTHYRCEFAWDFTHTDEVQYASVDFEVDLANVGVIEEPHREAVREMIRQDAVAQRSAAYLHSDRKSELEAMVDLSAVGTYGASRFIPALKRFMADTNAPAFGLRELQNSHRDDVQGESLYLITVLLLLNAVNATEQEPQDRRKLNKGRTLRGKPPLLNFNAVRMRLSKPERDRETEGGTGTGGPKSLHICRGHLKRLKRPDGTTRLVWWREHWRGDWSVGIRSPKIKNVAI